VHLLVGRRHRAEFQGLKTDREYEEWSRVQSDGLFFSLSLWFTGCGAGEMWDKCRCKLRVRFRPGWVNQYPDNFSIEVHKFFCVTFHSRPKSIVLDKLPASFEHSLRERTYQ
jgi:hypothetical protein